MSDQPTDGKQTPTLDGFLDWAKRIGHHEVITHYSSYARKLKKIARHESYAKKAEDKDDD